MAFHLVPVGDNKTVRQFHEVQRSIYRGDQNFICPPFALIENIFTPGKNTFFEHGSATRWILKDNSGKIVGRVAAFINEKKAFTFQVPTGGMGFFECINDREAAFTLFEACAHWLSERGMKAMDGPINFGENDNFWGLLVEGFIPQSFGMNYNKPYYKDLFEAYGFKMYFEQVTNLLDLRKPFPERFWKIADWVLQKPEYNFHHFQFAEAEKYINDFIEIYNDAWQFHENFTPITAKAVQDMIGDMKGLLVEEFVWFAYHENEPIAFELMLPDLNQLFRHFSGKINLWGKLKVLLKGKNKLYTRTRIVIMGVKPKYQRSGIESAIFRQMQKVMEKHPQYTEVELSWVGDFNPKMRALHEAVGATFSKRHFTYRKYFEAGEDAGRSTIIPVDTREHVVKK